MKGPTKIIRKRTGRGGSIWQGGLQDAIAAARGETEQRFDCVVFLAMEAQPTHDFVRDAVRGSTVTLIGEPLDDADLTREHRDRSLRLARQVARRVLEGQHVLVTCFMGWNRSGLVTALACHELTGHAGETIVRTLRVKRGARVLGNRQFERFVLGLAERKVA